MLLTLSLPILLLLVDLCIQRRLLITQLRLFLDQDNIILYEERIANSSVPNSEKAPILLPTKHYFTELIIPECHKLFHQDGIRETLNCVRERFWVPRGREAVKTVVRECVMCRKFEGKPFAAQRREPQLRRGRSPAHPLRSSPRHEFNRGTKVTYCVIYLSKQPSSLFRTCTKLICGVMSLSLSKVCLAKRTSCTFDN